MHIKIQIPSRGSLTAPGSQANACNVPGVLATWRQRNPSFLPPLSRQTLQVCMGLCTKPQAGHIPVESAQTVGTERLYREEVSLLTE